MSTFNEFTSPNNLSPELAAELDSLAADLPQLRQRLQRLRDDPQLPAACAFANAIILSVYESLCHSPQPADRLELLHYACEFFPRENQTSTLRRLCQDPSPRVRNAAAKAVRRLHIHEVALPASASRPWDASGWSPVVQRRGIARHPQGSRTQQSRGLPVLTRLDELRELLKIATPKQLGWLLTATDRMAGPYTRFAIAKRDGSDRIICAPRWKLRAVQRRILNAILYKIPPHPAAHGFVPKRSIATNAAPHVGAKLLMKFDLKNFFPTIHWPRVLGLFASLGYYAGDCRLATADRSPNVALTLSRLCCYTPDPADWNRCLTPQGAPTSPAIANLICRGLDARLTGVANSMNGVYTRYADDLTFSFQNPQLDVGRFRWWVDQICHQEGFFVNQDKMRVIRAKRRQRVTGIVVNQTMRVPREQRRRFRAILHNCREHGIDSQRRDRPDLESYLMGFASYLHMVHPEEGREAMRQVRELLEGSRLDR